MNSEERKQAAMTMFRGPAYATGVVLKSAVCLGLIALLVVIGSGEEKAEIAREARNDASRPTSPAKSSTLDDGYVRLETRPSDTGEPGRQRRHCGTESGDAPRHHGSGLLGRGRWRNGRQWQSMRQGAGGRCAVSSATSVLSCSRFLHPGAAIFAGAPGPFFLVIQPDRGIRPGASGCCASAPGRCGPVGRSVDRDE